MVENVSFETPSGTKGFSSLAKKFLFILFMVYATLFLAVATPFLSPHSPVIYAIGGLICAGMLVRFAAAVYRYKTLGKVSITVHRKGITYTSNGNTVDIPGMSITHLEHSPLGDLIIREKDGFHVFPISILPREKRKELLLLFTDMVPSRTIILRKAWELGDAIVMAMILAVHIIHYIVGNFFIPTGSMIPTLMVHDHLFAEKLTFGPRVPKMIGMDKEIHIKIPFITREIRRGDIIIFNPPIGETEKDYIKRCIAVAGDEFHIKDNSVYINGVKQAEPYANGVSNYSGFNDRTQIEGVVPKGMVIAMGDNREHSLDSRYFGYVPVERIKAKALLLYFNRDQLREFDFSRYGLIR